MFNANRNLLSLVAIVISISLASCSKGEKPRGAAGNSGRGGGPSASQTTEVPSEGLVGTGTDIVSNGADPSAPGGSGGELGPVKVFEMVASGKAGENKVFFNHVQRQVKLDPRFLATITPEMLNEWGNSNRGQEKLDQFYSLLPSGYIPEGPHRGTVIFAKDDNGEITVERMVRALRLPIGADTLKSLAQSIWKGKKFEVDEGRPILRNMMELVDAEGNKNTQNIRLFNTLFHVDPLKAESGVIVKDVYEDGRKLALVMPARVFCGVSLLDSRRESIIIDYEYSDDDFEDGIDGYLGSVDDLAGRKGLKIRDEIRMIRPGLYLGRAYITNVFFLNFVLESETPQVSSVVKKQDCYDSSRPGFAQRYIAD